MKTKYDGRTPGDWHLRRLTNKQAAEVCCHDPNSIDPWHIAEICGGLEEREIEANAQLLADSPKLLAALVKIVEAERKCFPVVSASCRAELESLQNRYNAIDEARKLIQEEAK